MESQFRLSTIVGSSAGPRESRGIGRLTLLSNDLPLGRLVGKGLCGIVHETAWRASKYAMKDFVDVPRETFKGEIYRLSRLGEHENVVNTYGYSFGSRSCSLLLELMDDDLLSFMQKEKESKRKPLRGNSSSATSRRISLIEFTTVRRTFSDPSSPCPPPLDLPVALDIMLQIAMGMEYLHENGIAHGDLKPRNVLVRYSNQGVLVKVSDYGLIQSKNASTYLVSNRTRMFDMAQWKAPEYLRECKLDEKCANEEDEHTAIEKDFDGGLLREADVYSFGMTSFQILTGELPFHYRPWKDLVKCKTHPEGLRPALPETFEPRLVQLLESCWADSTQDRPRPTFLAICEELKKIKNPPVRHIQPGDVSDSEFDFSIPVEATSTYYKLHKSRSSRKRWKKAFRRIPSAVYHLTASSVEFCTPSPREDMPFCDGIHSEF